METAIVTPRRKLIAHLLQQRPGSAARAVYPKTMCWSFGAVFSEKDAIRLRGAVKIDELFQRVNNARPERQWRMDRVDVGPAVFPRRLLTALVDRCAPRRSMSVSIKAQLFVLWDTLPSEYLQRISGWQVKDGPPLWGVSGLVSLGGPHVAAPTH